MALRAGVVFKRALALGRNVTFLYIRGGFLGWKYYVFILGDLVRVELFRFCLGNWPTQVKIFRFYIFIQRVDIVREGYFIFI